MKYANVVVHVPLIYAPTALLREDPDNAPLPRAWLDRSFTYSVPEELQDTIHVGQLVWVPFGSRRLQGIVVELAETTDLESTRPLEAIVNPEPFLNLAQIELAHWMSNYYLAPLSDCIWLFLPPGLEDKVETVIEPASPAVAADNLTEKQRAFVERVREAGSIKSVKLKPAERALANALVERGILVKRSIVRPGRAKPRRVDTAHLIVSLETARAMIAGLDRRTAVIRALSSADNALTQEELVSRTRVGETTLQRLERDGIIERTSRAARYQLTQAYLDKVPALPPNQARVGVYLREHGHSATTQELERALEISSLTLSTLRANGWIEKTDEPALVRMRDAKQTPALSTTHQRLHNIVELLANEPSPMWVSALYAATDARRSDLQKLEQLGLITLETTEVVRDPLAGKSFVPVPPPTLTSEQEAAWREIERVVKSRALPRDSTISGGLVCPAFLLHGVTGSGKTEIYLNAVQETLAQGKQAIALVPEISLTPQTIRRFGARFGDRVGVIHSRLSDGERFDTWRRIREGKIDVVVGARSAIFAPLPRPGLVVLDEEHDNSYKNEVEFHNQPGYHTRELALEMARRRGIVVILGSATPDVETFARARRGEFTLLELPQRVISQENQTGPVHYQELPPVEIVDLRAELVSGNRSIFSRVLKKGLEETLARGEQAILFLNRRGSASAVVCRDCGRAVRCPRCDNPYTLHTFGDRDARALVCHHCGKRAGMPRKCPNCGSTRIRGLGLGTEKLEEQVRAEFPVARTLRWDYDVTQGKDSHELLLDTFARGDANVLIGTQMIAKGMDFPRVTLVGVVNADSGLYLPDFRAGERTFQLLTQVAGRAGRSAQAGKAIVQTYAPEQYAIRLAATHDYAEFFKRELEFRREAAYPPFRPLVRLLYSSESADSAREASAQFAAQLQDRIRREGLLDVEVIGPAPAFFSRLRGRYRHHVLLRGTGAHELLETYPPPPNWRIDVDPRDLL